MGIGRLAGGSIGGEGLGAGGEGSGDECGRGGQEPCVCISLDYEKLSRKAAVQTVPSAVRQRTSDTKGMFYSNQKFQR